jgi:hypothetical protein
MLCERVKVLVLSLVKLAVLCVYESSEPASADDDLVRLKVAHDKALRQHCFFHHGCFASTSSSQSSSKRSSS